MIAKDLGNSNELEFDSFVSVSYSSSDKFAFQYLYLALETLGVTPRVFERNESSSKANISNSIKFHFLIIPNEYYELFNPINYLFEKEVKWILENNQECCIVFIRASNEISNSRIDELIDSTRRISLSDVEVLTLSTHDSFFNFTQKVAGLFMDVTAFDPISKIMTPIEQLGCIKKNAFFSELYYKMGTMGVRHFPVIDSKTGECSRIISRRDLVKLVPPGNILIPQEVQDETGITISPMKLLSLVDNLSDKRIEDLFLDQDLISIKPSDPIAKAVDLLSTRHDLGGKRIYISGLPVMEGKKLLGFLSYTDLLKRFIKNQEDYLQTTIEEIAKLDSPNEPLYRLHESHYLRDALMRMENFGVRSLPVVDKDKSDKLIGFVEDIQVIAYNHPAFADELGSLGVQHFMTPVDRLHTPMPGQTLKNCIDKFSGSVSGSYAPSTLIICNTTDGDDKRLRGVLSYVDVLREWKKISSSKEEKLVAEQN
ncbi:CBS domain-containing protein [Trichocoleus sp. FACHB-262]|uniref:CBS domain-containing protein n=1 Tax=Trichocoleus sp. FACHB-262 TaxID=2692869 RepID=UPI00168868CC|nr:CBS domain-containing protein [Trichocoleus sp. FACHB-262]MBD2124570.1 CBS domain-containing protein [Trichocoleus sp. FACHB-262]